MKTYKKEVMAQPPPCLIRLECGPLWKGAVNILVDNLVLATGGRGGFLRQPLVDAVFRSQPQPVRTQCRMPRATLRCRAHRPTQGACVCYRSREFLHLRIG